jgi:DNA adenine methylase
MATRYRGNKSPTSLYPKIIGTFPPHKIYWELFAGTGQILLKKKAAQINIVVDINDALVHEDKNVYPAGTVVINNCAISLLADLQHLGKDHLIYLDPPYIISSRLQKRAIYKHELTDDQHRQLLLLLLACRSNVAISHYRHKLYDQILKGWHRLDMKVSYRGSVVTECLYMNYEPGILHETTYTGKDKTDRQRIKRKGDRLVKKLLSLPIAERQSILEKVLKHSS